MKQAAVKAAIASAPSSHQPVEQKTNSVSMSDTLTADPIAIAIAGEDEERRWEHQRDERDSKQNQTAQRAARSPACPKE